MSAAPQKRPPSWKLAPPHDTRTQGMVVSGFISLPTGRALFLEFGWKGVAKKKQGGAWLRALQQVAPITDADGRDERSAGLGLTWEGMRKMGLAPNALASFDRPFKEGMFQEDRLRRLGDRREDKWCETVIPGGPRWSGNTPLDDAAVDDEARAFDDEEKITEKRVGTPITVHALLLLYEKDEETAEAWCKAVGEQLAPFDVKIVHGLPLDLREDERGIAREHFGFADGVSQPAPFEPGAVIVKGGADYPHNKWNSVPLGEVLMGHENGHHEVALGPVVADSKEGRDAGLLPHPRGVGFLDLGLDGSYMVVRELKQDVTKFWESMEAGAERIRKRDPQHSGHIDAQWIADRVIGRDLDGNLLCPLDPKGVLPVDQYGQPQNDFYFFDRDRLGLGCPLGSHVRRGNPRDGLAPTENDRETLLAAANNHRILRRGRKYGPTIVDRMQDDGADRGLLFICLNTDITRQFEFVQQTWMLNQNFAFLYDEVDPLIGPKGMLTIPEKPLRRIIEVDTFVKMAGGEYFFLPSMQALSYLESL